MENLHNQKVLIEDIPSRIACVLLSAVCAGLMCAVFECRMSMSSTTLNSDATMLVLQSMTYNVKVDEMRRC